MCIYVKLKKSLFSVSNPVQHDDSNLSTFNFNSKKLVPTIYHLSN